MVRKGPAGFALALSADMIIASPRASAAAFATARLTARMAFAPSRALFGVPSSAISAASISGWSSASMPEIASRISPFTASTAWVTPLPR